jgi:hypothetical protein
MPALRRRPGTTVNMAMAARAVAMTSGMVRIRRIGRDLQDVRWNQSKDSVAATSANIAAAALNNAVSSVSRCSNTSFAVRFL